VDYTPWNGEEFSYNSAVEVLGTMEELEIKLNRFLAEFERNEETSVSKPQCTR